MLTKKTLVSTLFAASMIGVAAMPLSSMAQVGISLNFGPPAVQYEAVPVAREGYTYQPNRWQEKDGHWNLERARWERK